METTVHEIGGEQNAHRAKNDMKYSIKQQLLK